MTDRSLNDKIKGAFDRAAPDVLDAVRAQCETQKGTVIPMTQPGKKRFHVRRFGAIAAALALVIALGAGAGAWQSGHAVAATVSLDVNPSLEIRVNRHETVLEVIPLNEDAEIVIGEMDFVRSDLDVTINALIGSMLRNGYLSELANSILISVDDADAARGKALEVRLAGEVDALLRTGSFQGSVLSQTITADDQLEDLARQYRITPGKAQLIRQIVAQDARYTFEALTDLSINELNLLSESGSLQLEDVAATGSASDKAYIGIDHARQLALAHAGVRDADAFDWEWELDLDDGQMVYELDFRTADGEYEYEVHALTGEILFWELERQKPDTPVVIPTPAPDAPALTADEARSAALTHAGVRDADAYDWECELDRENGRAVYEIEFKSGGLEYSYEIDTHTGAVLCFEREEDHPDDDDHDDRDEDDDRYDVDDEDEDDDDDDDRYDDDDEDDRDGDHDDDDRGEVRPSPAPTGRIQVDAAKAAALAHAGVRSADAYDWECELDRENGRTVYEIEFKSGGLEYSYEIDAHTGTVLNFEAERDD